MLRWFHGLPYAIKWGKLTVSPKIDVLMPKILLLVYPFLIFHRKFENSMSTGETYWLHENSQNSIKVCLIFLFHSKCRKIPTLRSLIQGEALIKGEAGIFLQI